MSEKLKISQWNCRSLPSKWSDLNNFAKGYDIVGLGKTWLKGNQKFTIRGYNTVRKDRDGGERGGE